MINIVHAMILVMHDRLKICHDAGNLETSGRENLEKTLALWKRYADYYGREGEGGGGSKC